MNERSPAPLAYMCKVTLNLAPLPCRLGLDIV